MTKEFAERYATQTRVEKRYASVEKEIAHLKANTIFFLAHVYILKGRSVDVFIDKIMEKITST
jgi:hypothetical protein